GFQLPLKELQIEIDTYLMEQVLINLIINAIEASAEKEHPKVQVSADKKLDGRVYISVADNGTGISEEIMEEIFIPFFTTKKEGSGIGLSLSKQIMTMHGGKIQIESNPGLGAKITLLFSELFLI
ncbi:MAG: ATP-binding protein, partial [Christiangramia sp.]